MSSRIVRTLGVVAFAVGALGLAACRDSTSASTGPAPKAAAADKAEALPSDYVPFRCMKCNCRLFSGHEARCSRTSCQHSWKDHQRP